MNTITQKDLAERWKCSLRTVQRRCVKYQLPPVGFEGQELAFDLDGVARVEQERLKKRMRSLGFSEQALKFVRTPGNDRGIISTPEAKRRAKVGR
jgi:hypothetical protein